MSDQAPLAFRDRDLVLTIFDYVADVDDGPPVTWAELLTVFGTELDHRVKTVENAVYELVAFGALHRIGRPAGRKGGKDTRAVVATPLGKAWRDGRVPGLPGEPEDPIEAADQIGADLEDGQALLDDVTTTIGTTTTPEGTTP